jgi:hypothetical protein
MPTQGWSRRVLAATAVARRLAIWKVEHCRLRRQPARHPHHDQLQLHRSGPFELGVTTTVSELYLPAAHDGRHWYVSLLTRTVRGLPNEPVVDSSNLIIVVGS